MFSSVLNYGKYWSQGVHGRTDACHASGAGSLPAETAKQYPHSSKVEHSADNRETVDRYHLWVPVYKYLYPSGWALNYRPTQRYGVPVFGKQEELWAGMYQGGESALQAPCGEFDSPSVHHKEFFDRNAQRCAAGLLIRVRLVRSQFGQPR